MEVEVHSFESLGRVVHFHYKPRDFTASDMDRIFSDWLAPLSADDVIEIGGSTFWLSSLCLFRPTQRMLVFSANVASRRAWTWSCAVDGLVPLHDRRVLETVGQPL